MTFRPLARSGAAFVPVALAIGLLAACSDDDGTASEPRVTSSSSTSVPASPTVVASRGATVHEQDCTSPTCARLHVEWSGLSDGTHSYTCADDDGTFYTREDGGLPDGTTLSGPEGAADLWCYADAGFLGGVVASVDGVPSAKVSWG